jgi:hypothetical protein
MFSSILTLGTADAVRDFGRVIISIWEPFRKSRLKESIRIMTEYVVGLRHGKRSEALTVEAEDALIAALKAKHNHPGASISYVRKSNRRGDRRNPHRKE